MMFGLTKLQAYGIAVIVFTIALGGFGAYCYQRGKAVERKAWEAKQASAVQQDLASLKDAVFEANMVSNETLDAIKKIKVVNTTRTGVIEREIQNNVVYSNDCLPDTGRVLWNSISAGRPVMPSGGTGTGTVGGRSKLPDANGSGNSGREGRNSPIKP